MTFDDFNRADSSTSVGTASSGHVWEALVTGAGIQSNRAYRVSGGPKVVIETGQADGTLQATLTTTAVSSGLGFRSTATGGADGYEGWYFRRGTGTTYQLDWHGAGGTIVASGSGPTSANGDVLKVELSGQNIKAYVNSTLVYDINHTQYLTNTKHGFHLSASGSATLDDWSFAQVTGRAVSLLGTTFNGDEPSTSIVVDKPTGTTAGDFMIATVLGVNETITPPSNWTLLDNTLAGTSSMRSHVYYKRAAAGEASSYTWGMGGAGSLFGVAISTWRGVDLNDPIQHTVSNGDSASEPQTTPSITSTRPGLLLFFRQARDDSSTEFGFTPDGNYPEVYDQGVSGSTTRYEFALYRAGALTEGGLWGGIGITSGATETANVYRTIHLNLDARASLMTNTSAIHRATRW